MTAVRKRILRPTGPEIAIDAGDIATKANSAAARELLRRYHLGENVFDDRAVEVTTSGRIVLGPLVGGPLFGPFGYLSRTWAEKKLAELTTELRGDS